MIEVDMHTHSCFSDGGDEPGEIVRKAKNLRLKAVCLTDHDAFQGLPEFMAEAKKQKIETMSGIEINSFYRGLDVHILGYGFDHTSPLLASKLRRNWRFFEDSSNRSIAAFAKEGMAGITLEKARELTDSRGPIFSISHHFSKLLAEKQGINFWQARGVTRFTGVAEMGDTDRLLKPEEAVALIKSLGGVAVLAHPGELARRSSLPARTAMVLVIELIERLKDAGLFGLEVFHSKHTQTDTEKFYLLARKLKLFVTAGSDYHGQFKPQIRLGKRGMKFESFMRMKKICG